MVVTSLASTIMAAPKSAIQFWDTIGTKQTALFGWSGDSATGNFFIEAPKGTEALNVQNGQVNVKGTINATAVRGDGNNLTNINPASHAHSQYINKQQSDSSYYLKTEVNTKLIAKSDTGHAHDSRYNTKAEITTLLTTKADTGNVVRKVSIDTVLRGTGAADLQVWKYSNSAGKPSWQTLPAAQNETDPSVASYMKDSLWVKGKLAGKADTGRTIAAGGITSLMLADTAVTSSKIKSNSIQTSHIADNQITSAKIVNATIVQADLSAELSAKVDKVEAIGAFDDNIDNVFLISFYSGSTLPLATVTIVAPAAGVILLNGSALVQHLKNVTQVPVWASFSITENTTIGTNDIYYNIVVQANDNPTICHQTKGFSVNAGPHTYRLLIGRGVDNLTPVGVRNASLTAIYVRQ